MQYRGYRIESLGTYPMFKIQAAGSGDIPNVLKGLFTKTDLAQRTIDAHLESLKTKTRKKRSVKDDKETSAPSG